jgi:hypothetical protein
MTMGYDEKVSRRINNALHRNIILQKLRAELIVYESENIRHAKTNSESDYLDLLKSEYRLVKLVEDALYWDNQRQKELIEGEAWSECNYDLKEKCFLDDNGEPYSPGCTPPGYADYRYEMKRDSGEE